MKNLLKYYDRLVILKAYHYKQIFQSDAYVTYGYNNTTIDVYADGRLNPSDNFPAKLLEKLQ